MNGEKVFIVMEKHPNSYFSNARAPSSGKSLKNKSRIIYFNGSKHQQTL